MEWDWFRLEVGLQPILERRRFRFRSNVIEFSEFELWSEVQCQQYLRLDHFSASQVKFVIRQ